MDNLDDLRAEHRRVVESMAFAFAMGHHCAIGRHPFFEEVLEKERRLRALIAEQEMPGPG
jgi:hypothetical protein